MNSPILAPVVALAGWSMVMLLWMMSARAKGVQGVDPALLARPGMRGIDLEGIVPGKAQWPSHNYNHLMEQPTVFYAVAIVLALAGGGTGIDLYLAWAYMGLRVLHSLVQATSNKLSIRFPLWGLSSLVLIAMTVRAGMLVF
ncbi:MAG: MAPEG family protein [Rhodospirillaceae bacterium]|nr:MAG: MAPEG family protein [Rhodospirillaceae bacterium]